MKDITVNRFRQARGRLLTAQINRIGDELGRKVEIVDIGGRPDYWDNVDTSAVSRIVLYNLEAEELDRGSATHKFDRQVGDARNLPFEKASVDLVHSNSVIEHVGHWWDMQAMAAEVQRVGRHGWVQTPAWEFPIEPHYRLPFLHWLAPPARRALLKLSPKYGCLTLAERRMHVDRINLLSRAEIEALFPGRRLHIERVLLTKSYTAIW
jgi:hypothetical protein